MLDILFNPAEAQGLLDGIEIPEHRFVHRLAVLHPHPALAHRLAVLYPLSIHHLESFLL